MRTFKLLVLANHLDWASLPAKIEAVKAFYAPVCNLDIEIRRVSLYPTYALYPELAPLYVIDRGYYDLNIAAPNALAADIILFVTEAPLNIATYEGYMSFNNVGPWETTVFAHGENDHTYVDGKDLGDAFVLMACHELSHAFYRICGKRDATHRCFPSAEQLPGFAPHDVLPSFDFGTRYAILEWLKDKLLSAATALSLMRKQHLETTV
jgi:hypothetical protein